MIGGNLFRYVVPKTLSLLKILCFFFRFYYECERGLFPNTEFVFDLELPVDFIPANKDGEVQKFDLVPATECVDKILSSDFKVTSAPVVLDFLIRHGVVRPEIGK